MLRSIVFAGLVLCARAAMGQDSTVLTSPGDVTSSSMLSNSGSHTYNVVAEESDDIPAAIERAVEHMNFITRPIARHRLRETNPLPQQLRLDIIRDTITVRLGDAPPAALPRDGSWVPWRSIGGDKCRISAALAGDTLTEHIAAHGGQSETRYVMLDGGSRVREEVRITSSHLSQPVVYTVTFVKAP